MVFILNIIHLMDGFLFSHFYCILKPFFISIKILCISVSILFDLFHNHPFHSVSLYNIFILFSLCVFLFLQQSFSYVYFFVYAFFTSEFHQESFSTFPISVIQCLSGSFYNIILFTVFQTTFTSFLMSNLYSFSYKINQFSNAFS